MTSPHFPHTDTPSAELRSLRLAYPKGDLVLNGLDWQLLPGQVVGLLGRNGAGKTTLLEALLGLREPQAGTVKLFGQDAQQLDDAIRQANQMLALARADAIALTPAPLDLHALAEATTRSLWALARERGMVVQVQVLDLVPTLHADRRALARQLQDVIGAVLRAEPAAQSGV